LDAEVAWAAADDPAVAFRQIGGLIARRVVFYKRPGEQVETGERASSRYWPSQNTDSLGPMSTGASRAQERSQRRRALGISPSHVPCAAVSPKLQSMPISSIRTPSSALRSAGVRPRASRHCDTRASSDMPKFRRSHSEQKCSIPSALSHSVTSRRQLYRMPLLGL